MTILYLVSSSPSIYVTIHERSCFVEYIISGIMALGETSDMMDFYWCEYEMQAVKEIDKYDNKYNLMNTQKRFLDALGKMERLLEMERVIVESSSGPLDENVQLIIEDTLKIHECTSSSLKKEALKYKDPSIKTFMRLQLTL
ncbi:hypothetical protein BDC45DRAFT_436080 [Circinella umbellata]|nr:hypothetical protein BDC45DRAFT_436080 [Circinella umbellata]